MPSWLDILFFLLALISLTRGNTFIGPVTERALAVPMLVPSASEPVKGIDSTSTIIYSCNCQYIAGAGPSYAPDNSQTASSLTTDHFTSNGHENCDGQLLNFEFDLDLYLGCCSEYACDSGDNHHRSGRYHVLIHGLFHDIPSKHHDPREFVDGCYVAYQRSGSKQYVFHDFAVISQ